MVITDHCSNTACVTGRRICGGNGAGVAALLDSGGILCVISICDIPLRFTDNACHTGLGSDVCLIQAVAHRGLGGGIAHNTASRVACGGHRAGNGQVMHLAVGTQSADQALIVRRAVDVQVPHREARTVQFAGKTLAGVADGRPGEARQINVFGQLALDIVGSGVYRLGKPCQFRAGADLVYTFLKLRLGDGRTVPCALHCLFQHNGNGQDTILYLCRAAGTQRKAAGVVDIALRLHIVTVGIIGRILV